MSPALRQRECATSIYRHAATWGGAFVGVRDFGSQLLRPSVTLILRRKCAKYSGPTFISRTSSINRRKYARDWTIFKGGAFLLRTRRRADPSTRALATAVIDTPRLNS